MYWSSSLTNVSALFQKGKMSIRDIFPTSTVVAATFGAFLAALRGDQYSYLQRVSAFITGFAAAIYLAPYMCERIGIASETGKNSIVFLVGYVANMVMPRAALWFEQRLPELLDTVIRRKSEPKNE